MRLVDADKQLIWVDCMKPIHGIGLEPVVAVETVRDLIKGAPTIDAIPVEFLMWYAQLPTEFAIAAWRKPKEEALKATIKSADKPMPFDDAIQLINSVLPYQNDKQEAGT